MSSASLRDALLTEDGLTPARADALLAAASWAEASALLRPTDPFSAHLRLFAALTADHDPAQGPAPAWTPTAPAQTRILRLTGADSFAAAHHRSVQDPEGYWSAILAALRIHFDQPPARMLDQADGTEHARWLPGARLNIAESCFVGRDPGEVVLIWQDEDGPLQTMTRGQLDAESAQVARALQAAGLPAGQAIAVDMPMTAASVVIYLGVVRHGSAVVSIADSFAPAEIATRLRISGAAAIFTQDVILRGKRALPLYTRVQEAGAPLAIVLPADGAALCMPLRDGDRAWDDFLAGGAGEGWQAPVADAEAATNVLFSSGTTGEPKAIPWTHLTPIKAAADGLGHHDIGPGDVLAWPTNLGWMMGPWLVYASLLNGAAMALYQGTPTGRGFCRFVQDAGVTMLGVVPSLVRSWRAEDATAGLDWSAVRRFSSTGEASSPEDMLWLMGRANYAPVIEYCGGTEIGGGYICGSMAQPQAPATFSSPSLGCALLLLDEAGRPAEVGEIALVPPMLGASGRLLNRDHHAVYFAGMPRGPQGEVLRRHGDQIAHLGGGYYRAQGRVDDTMNLGGIKVSSAELERACQGLVGVREVAAVAVSPPGGGPEELVLVVVAEDAAAAEALDVVAVQASAQRAIRATLSPLFKVARVVTIEALPRTASNKVMRRLLRDRLRA